MEESCPNQFLEASVIEDLYLSLNIFRNIVRVRLEREKFYKNISNKINEPCYLNIGGTNNIF